MSFVFPYSFSFFHSFTLLPLYFYFQSLPFTRFPFLLFPFLLFSTSVSFSRSFVFLSHFLLALLLTAHFFSSSLTFPFILSLRILSSFHYFILLFPTSRNFNFSSICFLYNFFLSLLLFFFPLPPSSSCLPFSVAVCFSLVSLPPSFPPPFLPLLPFFSPFSLLSAVLRCHSAHAFWRLRYLYSYKLVSV